MRLFEPGVKVGVVGGRCADDAGRDHGSVGVAAIPLVAVVVVVVVVAAGPRRDG
jgi:hypothetical protein